MILEGIVTTLSADGVTNIAPMGPIVDPAMSTLTLRPFKSSTTWANLSTQRCGVFHVVDDVLLIAQAAIGRIDPVPTLVPAKTVRGMILADACRSYEFEVTAIDDSADRAEVIVRVVRRGRHRDFFGFNRAKHAVLEAAILATRMHLIPRKEIEAQFESLRIIVDKTAGPREHAAFKLLLSFVTGGKDDQRG